MPNKIIPFENSRFIKPDIEYKRSGKNYAPMFRRVFSIEEDIQTAEIYVCGLGYGYYYINGAAVSDNLLTAPYSDYRKSLWYNTYDVTDKLVQGKNIIAVICGNGWYNEDIETVWHFHTASWRDHPKFILELRVNGKAILCTDDSWKCTVDTPIIYNQLRSGEHFDSRMYDPGWKLIDFDDSRWNLAKTDDNPPKGRFRECVCEPIRECEVFDTKEIIKISDSKYVFDVGQNISGYIRLKVNQPSGDRLKIRYAELLHDDNSLNLNNMTEDFYKDSQLQTDEFICCGREIIWSPKFTYHGFRYIEIEGIKNPSFDSVKGVFIHQDVQLRSAFECSEPVLNKLFKAGQMSTFSNMFYLPTDCPTREKMGWANDVQASAEQFLTNFKAEKFLEKWLRDIYDCVRDDGAVPCVIPTYDYGFAWGCGPVSDGAMFEVPFRLYLHTGKAEYLCKSYPYFMKYFEYLDSRTDADGTINFGLGDWACPNYEDSLDPTLINAVYKVKFLRIAQLAANLCGESCVKLKNCEDEQTKLIFKKYFNADGTCKVNTQTATAMLIYHDIYLNLPALAKQLKKLIENADYHHNCGMVGLRHLYIALNKCGLQEYAYKIITAKGIPSYSHWLEQGATTLWEHWYHEYSRNHHMYSDFMSWMMKTIIGINTDFTDAENPSAQITPYFFEELDWAKGRIDTNFGEISVSWMRKVHSVEIEITVPPEINISFQGKHLSLGTNKFVINVKKNS